MSKFAAQITLSIEAEDIGEANADLRRCVEAIGPHLRWNPHMAVTGSAVGESPQLEQSHNDTPCGAGSEG